MGRERLSSEPIEVLEIDDATNFHQFLLNQIMNCKEQLVAAQTKKKSSRETNSGGAVFGTGGRTDPYDGWLIQ